MRIFCACGRHLHYTDSAKQAYVERLVAEVGPDVVVRSPNGTWLVQRHYIALHDLKASELPKLRFPQVLDDAKLFVHFLYDVGGVKIALDKPDFGEQVFHHVDPDDDRQRHFYVPKLKSIIAQHPEMPLAHFAVTEDQAQFVIAHHGVDEAGIARLSEAELDQPGIMCIFADGSQLVVDGNHRLVAKARRYDEFMQFFMVPEIHWRKSLLKVPNGFDLK